MLYEEMILISMFFLFIILVCFLYIIHKECNENSRVSKKTLQILSKIIDHIEEKQILKEIE